MYKLQLPTVTLNKRCEQMIQQLYKEKDQDGKTLANQPFNN